MAVGIDAVLTPNADGILDISIDPATGDIKTESFFDTAIIVSLFADRRATASEVKASHLRRGWIGNESTPGIQIGSTLWQFEQVRITGSTLSQISDAAKDALLWLVEDGHATAVRAEATSTVSSVRLAVTIERPNSKVINRSFELWENTG